MNKGYLDIADRLLEHFVPLRTPECWPWTGQVNSRGYGTFKLKGKKSTAHRIIYSRFIGSIPSGMDVAHQCHNRICVNPWHLYLATRSQNMLDSVKAGRRLGPEKGKFHHGRPRKH